MKKRSVWVALVGLLVALVLVSCGVPEAAGEKPGAAAGAGKVDGVRVSCIDVGKGDCLLIQSGGSSGLIDTGYEDTADEVISHLRKQGVKSLDFVVLTHYDRDHVEGMSDIGEAFKIGAVYLPNYEGADKNYYNLLEALEDLKIKGQPVEKKLTFAMGDATLTVFPTTVTFLPFAEGDEGNDNDMSLVATLTCGKDSYLFAGDLEEEGIEEYLEAGHGAFDVVKMPHHGRKASNMDEFLDQVDPQIALITDSLEDSADKKVLKLLTKAGVDTYSTAEDGTIVVTSTGAGQYTVTTE